MDPADNVAGSPNGKCEADFRLPGQAAASRARPLRGSRTTALVQPSSLSRFSLRLAAVCAMMSGMRAQRLIIGISGASGAIYGIRMLEVLGRVAEVETHLIITPAAKRTITIETDLTVPAVEELADRVYPYNDIAAAVSSGSFRAAAMVVIPCSMRTLSGIALSYADNLLQRAADVTLKERRPLVLVTRETPLHLGHLRLMAQATEMGAIIHPPVPAFYHRPKTLDDVINQTVNRVTDLLDITLPEDLFQRWGEAGG